MQTSIYYFSATGNSLYAAKRLAEKIGDCRLTSIPAMQEEKIVIPNTNAVGLVFPMHYFGVPPIVKQFVAKLDLAKVTYVFAVATCGNAVLSSVMHELQKLLQAKGSSLSAGFYVTMVDTYIPVFPMPGKEVQTKILAKSDKKLDRLAEQIAARNQSIENEYLWFVCRPIHNYWLRRFDKIDRKFTNNGQCTSCGQCARVCPVGNIALADGRPMWLHHCQECLACLHACPARSIEFGRSKGKERYHHPQISWQEIIEAQNKNN